MLYTYTYTYSIATNISGFGVSPWLAESLSEPRTEAADIAQQRSSGVSSGLGRPVRIYHGFLFTVVSLWLSTVCALLAAANREPRRPSGRARILHQLASIIFH